MATWIRHRSDALCRVAVESEGWCERGDLAGLRLSRARCVTFGPVLLAVPPSARSCDTRPVTGGNQEFVIKVIKCWRRSSNLTPAQHCQKATLSVIDA